MVKNNLGEILKERGIKQKWLADKVGVTETTISNIIKDRNGISIELAFMIADVLKLSITDIFYYIRSEEK